MNERALIEQTFELLIGGDRRGARALIAQSLEAGMPPDRMISDVFWPLYQSIDRLYRNDQMSLLSYNLSSKLLRVLTDQVAANLSVQPATDRRVFAMCGPEDADELGAQMAVDLLEANGFHVTFAGGGVPNDEVLAQLHEAKPQAVLIFASAPTDLPNIRHLIDSIEEIGACKDLQVVVGGGVFNRASGLAEEIGADLWAEDPIELVEAMIHEAETRATPDQRTVGRRRRAA